MFLFNNIDTFIYKKNKKLGYFMYEALHKSAILDP